MLEEPVPSVRRRYGNYLSVRSRYSRHYDFFEYGVRNERGFVDYRQVELPSTYRDTVVREGLEPYLRSRSGIEYVFFAFVVFEHVAETFGKFDYVVANRPRGRYDERRYHYPVFRYERTLYREFGKSERFSYLARTYEEYER